MLNTRTLALSGIAAVIAVVIVWKWVAGWGLVTLDVSGAPLAKVIKSIERQGGVKISTNADPTTPVTMIVDHVPAYEAVDTLAIAIEAETRLAYVAAKNSRQIKDVLAAFSGGNNPGGWVVLAGGRGGGGPREGDGQNSGRSRENAQQGNQAAPQGQPPQPQTAQSGDQPRGERRQGGNANNTGGERRGGGGDQGGGFGGWTPGPMGDSLTDPRTIVWKPSDMPEKSLKSFFDQGSQKTGAIFALPEGWDPAITKVPKEGRIGEVTVRLAKSASGSVQEVFLLTVQPPRPQQTANNEENGNRWEFTRTVFSPTRGGSQRNQEWMAERMQAQIAALPAAEQAAVKKQMDEMRAFRESLQGLSEEERRAKFEEYMNRPDVQERMDERMSSRDSKTPPQKREQRMRQYLERKNQIKGPSQKS
jgi:hypothetical protein